MLDTLTRLTELYPAQARPLVPPVPLGNAGGLSGARLWRFESGAGPMVARAWPPDGPGPDALRTIHGWLARLTDLDFIPAPVATLDGRTLIDLDGRSWEVAPWRPGSADRSRPPPPARLAIAFSALAAVHQRLAFESTRAPSPGLATRRAEATGLLASELAQIESVVRRNPNDPLAGSALRWIALARDGLPALVARLGREASIAIRIQPVLRDARPDHFLFVDDRLTGLVDFGAMGPDSPAADLARLIGEWIGSDRSARSGALDAYAAVRPLDASETRLIDVFADSAAWLGPARWVRWHFVDRSTVSTSRTPPVSGWNARSEGSWSGSARRVRSCGPANHVISARTSSALRSTLLIAVARPVAGSTSTSAPHRRGSPVATSKKWGTLVNVAASTRS